MLRIIQNTLFIIILSLTSVVYAETLKFGSCTYEGEVKKGKANGVGIVDCADGSKFEGKFKKNKIRGKGKYTNSDNTIFEGKFRDGKLRIKIDKMTREIIYLNDKMLKSNYYEIRGTGAASNKWLEAVKNSLGTYELTAEGKKLMELALEAGGGGGGGGC